jgi:hypothetical protein
MAINLVYLIASMLVQAKAQADAEDAGNNQRRIAGERQDAEQDKIDKLMNQNLEQYMNPQEEDAMAQIIADKVNPAIKSIDSTTNFQDVDRFGSQGSVKNTAYEDALNGAITNVADKAKTKANMLAKVKAPTHMRQDQSMKTADSMQQQGVIGKNANDWYNNVSRLEIENAYKPDQGMMLLSQALGAYATMGADGGATGAGANAGANAGVSGTVNGIPVIEKSTFSYPKEVNLFNNANAKYGMMV